MKEKETEQTKELADIIIEKFRDLVTLESRILEAREGGGEISAIYDNVELSDPQDNPIVEGQKILEALELKLKDGIEEMEKIMSELKSETPSFKTYILPQMSEILRTLKVCDAAEQEELAQLVTTLTDRENTQLLEQLEAIIITRLRDQLEKIFGI